ncbi:MAG: NAD-dependent epimerase/dehydratase family protein [Gallionella sp.]|nr:NAD-dependent epimerase/dehydratase family protein [Gallionella sp.]
MNWLITGGCGFLGTALIKRLTQQGNHNIRVVDNLKTGTREDLALVAQFREIKQEAISDVPAGIELVVGDIMDDRLALGVSRGCDIIVHFAANTGVGPSVEDPRADMMANVLGTFNYLEAARIHKIPRFIFASSGAPAGEVEPPIHEELPPHPVSPYGASKLAGEGYCSAYKRTFGIDTVMLRFGNVYGPGSVHKASVVAKFIKRALDGDVLEIYGDGHQTRDFIFIDDLIDAVLLAATVPGIGGEAFQIATSRETTVGEMAEKLVATLNTAGVLDIRLVNAETRLGDVKRNFSDTTKAKKRLGWQAQVELDEGLRKTASYFLNK